MASSEGGVAARGAATNDCDIVEVIHVVRGVWLKPRRTEHMLVFLMRGNTPADLMLILGHAGITFGVALAAESLASHPRSSSTHSRNSLRARLHGSMLSLSRKIDLRLLFIGSLLPDIIDKPGLVLFSGVYGTGRLFAHSLLFIVVLVLAGAWRYRVDRRTGLLVLAYGSAMHLLLDAMWRTPSVFFWPFEGPLPQDHVAEGWLSGIFETLLTNPSVFLSEIAGGMLLMPVLWVIFRRVGLRRFLRYGTLE